MADLSLMPSARANKAADYLSTAERATLEARRAEIEASDRGYTSFDAERRRLDAMLDGSLACPLQADRLRIACRLPALDAERSRIVEALDRLRNAVPGASHGKLTAETLADLAITVDAKIDPFRFYASERAERLAQHRAWAVERLTGALAWLAAQAPLTVLSRDDAAEGGPVARVALCRMVDLAVAA